MSGFTELLDQVVDLLQQRRRLTYGFLKLQFDLDDDTLDVLKAEIIRGQRLAVDEDGEVLVWTGGSAPPARETGTDAVQTTPEPSTAPTRTSAAERRQLTVMFSDLVGSTRLSGQLDPEDLREVVRAYQATCEKVIREFDGNVVQHLGDGIVVYFGYPRAHEDDAERAVRAGLAVLDAMSELNDRLESEFSLRLGVRIGIHTGRVVVGEMGGGSSAELLALGEAPNVAARIEGEAEPDTVAISEATHHLVDGLFEVAALTPRTLKGVAEPMQLYRVLGTRDAALDWEGGDAAIQAPLVGRQSELNLLVDRWEQVKDGQGQIVLLSGEAGIGKSRLVRALRERIREPGVPEAIFRCSPFHRNSALHPIVQALVRELGFQRDHDGRIRLERLEGFAREQGLKPADSVPVLASLLSVPLDGHYAELELSAQRKKEETQRCLLQWLLGTGRSGPRFSLWEDVHWADPSTLEFLGLLIDQVPGSQTMNVVAYRPEFAPPWDDRSHVLRMIVNRFTRAQVDQMILWLAGGKTLPPEVVDQIVQKTDGVPLFVEEVTKYLLESELLEEEATGYRLSGSLPDLEIPTTLQDSLMARLDRQEVGKEVAQVGATLGREFFYELIRAVSPLMEEDLRNGLHRLVDAELLYHRGLPPDATYVFKHAMIQDVAYNSLLRKTRQEFHTRIVQVLEDGFAETVETQPELVAHHCTAADLPDKAVHYWKLAGEKAIERSAHQEAITHLTRGLEVNATLPETASAIDSEITMQVALGVPLTALRGYGAPEVAQAYARARELGDRMGDSAQRFRAVYGLWRHHLLRAEYASARELGEQLLELAQGEPDSSAAQVAAHRALGSTLFYLGEFSEALQHLEQVIGLPASPEVRSETHLYDVVDSWVTCRSYASWIYWFLGDPEKAVQESERSIAVAREIEHPFSVALALSFASWLEQFRGERARARERALEAIDISTQRGFEFWIGWNQIIESWSTLDEGDPATVVRQIDEGLESWRARHSELGLTYFLAILAQAWGAAGRFEDGHRVLDEAFVFVESTGERFWEPELHRLRGDLLAATPGGSSEGAEAEYLRAIELARQYGTPALEQRAAQR